MRQFTIQTIVEEGDLKCYSGLKKKEEPKAVIERFEMTELMWQLWFSSVGLDGKGDGAQLMCCCRARWYLFAGLALKLRVRDHLFNRQHQSMSFWWSELGVKHFSGEPFTYVIISHLYYNKCFSREFSQSWNAINFQMLFSNNWHSRDWSPSAVCTFLNSPVKAKPFQLVDRIFLVFLLFFLHSVSYMPFTRGLECWAWCPGGLVLVSPLRSQSTGEVQDAGPQIKPGLFTHCGEDECSFGFRRWLCMLYDTGWGT